MAMIKKYPLDIENVGEEIYTLLSKVHHDPHEFMRQVRADGYEWPLGMPKHIWLRCIPPRPGYKTCYVEAAQGTRGAFPATQVWEAWGDDSYEAILKNEAVLAKIDAQIEDEIGVAK